MLFFALFFVVFSTMHPERHFTDICPISNTFSQTFRDVFGEGWKSWFLQPLQWKNIVFEGPGPPIFNYFFNCFRTRSRSSFLVFFCRFVGRQGSRFGANGLHFLTPKKEAKKITRVYAPVCKTGGGYPTKIKDMPIRDGFPHQFTPAVPKGTVADLNRQSQQMISASDHI